MVYSLVPILWLSYQTDVSKGSTTPQTSHDTLAIYRMNKNASHLGDSSPRNGFVFSSFDTCNRGRQVRL